MGAHHFAEATNHVYLRTADSVLLLERFGKKINIEDLLKFPQKCMLLLFYYVLFRPIHSIFPGIEYDIYVSNMDLS